MPDVTSFEQDHWIEIAALVRIRLAKAAERSDLSPAELYDLSRAIETAQGNEVKAATFDQSLEERKKSLERDCMFGG